MLIFEEQYFVGAHRVTDVDPRTSKRADGTKTTPVRTTVHATSQRGRLEIVVREAIQLRQVDFDGGEEVTLDVKAAYLSPDMRLTFHQRPDGKFEADVVSAHPDQQPFDYYLAALTDGNVDYVIGCSQSGSGDRLQFVCTGAFDLGSTTAIVSLFAPTKEDLDDSFEANRSIVSSFVAR